MDEACSTHGRDEKSFSSRTLECKRPFEDLSVDGRVILELILGK